MKEAQKETEQIATVQLAEGSQINIQTNWLHHKRSALLGKLVYEDSLTHFQV